MTNFGKEEHIRRQLAKHPREASVIIAARAALRVAPLLIGELTPNDASLERIGSAVVLPVFRGLAAAWVVGQYAAPNSEVSHAATAAAAAIDASIRGYSGSFLRSVDTHAVSAAAYVMSAASYAAEVPVADDPAGTADAAIRSSTLAAGATDATGAADVTHAVSVDAELIDQGVSAATLALRPLWLDPAPPWLNEAKVRLDRLLLRANQDWKVWTDWYHARLDGRASIEAIELARVMIANEIWDQGPRRVNAEIASLLRRAEQEDLVRSQQPEWAAVLQLIEQASLGARFVKQDAYLVIDPSGDDSDIAAASDPIIGQLHDGIKRRAKQFIPTATRFDNQIGWTGFGTLAQRFSDAIDCPVDDIPKRIGTVYETILALGSFLEFDGQ